MLEENSPTARKRSLPRIPESVRKEGLKIGRHALAVVLRGVAARINREADKLEDDEPEHIEVETPSTPAPSPAPENTEKKPRAGRRRKS